MIAVTLDGVRLLDGRDDWRLLDSLCLGIAQAAGYGGTESAGAVSYLRELDPPTGPDDAVLWTWTDAPVKREHVSRPAPVAAVRATRSRVPVAA
jgi:hypothetical protein